MARELIKIQRNIYNAVSDFCGKLHHDEAWQNVSVLADIIRGVNGVDDVILGAGTYHNYITKSDPTASAYRDYETIVITQFGNLYGYIRCHAAGSVDDEFDRYDMTISLYPDKKRDLGEKRIIISQNQLTEIKKHLNEVMDSKKTVVSFTGDNAQEMGTNAQEKYNDALRAGLAGSSISLQGKSTNNNATDKDEITISFDSNASNIKDAVTNSVRNAVGNGADINKLNVKDNTEDITNGLSESNCYTKKQVEIARLYEMRRNGTVYTKKQLTEEILGQDIKSVINDMNSFEVLDAFSKVFGEEELQRLSSSWNMLDTIVDIYNSATPEQKEQFMSLIKG